MINFLLNTLGIWITVPLGVLLFIFSKHIHKHEKYYHIGAFIIAIVFGMIAFINTTTTIFIQIPILHKLIVDGNLSFSLFLLVMFAGAFRNKSKPRISFSLIRREMAAFGFILLIPHAIYRISLALSGYNSTGLFAMIIMLPLVVVSIPKIRKKIGQHNWKQIHKASYVVYFLIYIHLAFDFYFLNGNFVIQQSSYAWMYHLIYIVYLFLRLTRNAKLRLKFPF